MSRWRSFLPDLMTVRAVMVRAALAHCSIGTEKKSIIDHTPPTSSAPADFH